MLSFKNFLLEAPYSFIAKDSTDINNFPVTSKEGKEVIKYIYSIFKATYNQSWETSLPMTGTNPASTKTKMRALFDLNKLVPKLEKKFPSYTFSKTAKSLSVKNGSKSVLTITSGEGSRTAKAGGGKAGVGFEADLVQDLNNYKSNPNSLKYPDVVKQIKDILLKDYKINMDSDEFFAQQDGGKNQKRSPQWSASKGLTFTPSGDIGHIVTDVTIFAGSKPVYLSLKYSTQYFLINSSIKKYLHENDPDTVYKERDDVAYYFGFNPVEFYEPYDLASAMDKRKSDGQIKATWKKILEGVIGYGYIYIVQGGKHDVVMNNKSAPKVIINSVGTPAYAIKGKRKYSKLPITATINGVKLNLDCQFRGTTGSDVLPYYMRVLVK